MTLTPAEVQKATQRIEEEKAEKQRIREEKREAKEKKIRDEKRDKLVAPVLLIVTLFISGLLFLLSSR